MVEPSSAVAPAALVVLRHPHGHPTSGSCGRPPLRLGPSSSSPAFATTHASPNIGRHSKFCSYFYTVPPPEFFTTVPWGYDAAPTTTLSWICLQRNPMERFTRREPHARRRQWEYKQIIPRESAPFVFVIDSPCGMRRSNCLAGPRSRRGLPFQGPNFACGANFLSPDGKFRRSRRQSSHLFSDSDPDQSFQLRASCGASRATRHCLRRELPHQWYPIPAPGLRGAFECVP